MRVTATLRFRAATGADLPAIVRMLADDALGATRETCAEPLPAAYREAFADMQAQGGNEYLLAELDGAIAGCLQLTVIPGLSRRGMRRAQIEGVRVAADFRGRGVGEALFRHAIQRACDRAFPHPELAGKKNPTDQERAELKRFVHISSRFRLLAGYRRSPWVVS